MAGGAIAEYPFSPELFFQLLCSVFFDDGGKCRPSEPCVLFVDRDGSQIAERTDDLTGELHLTDDPVILAIRLHLFLVIGSEVVTAMRAEEGIVHDCSFVFGV